MTATITTWLDGRIQTVPADDPRLDAIQIARHIAALHALPVRERIAYFERHEQSCGRRARLALQDAFAADWQARRAR